jgi:hypothetical protein
MSLALSESQQQETQSLDKAKVPDIDFDDEIPPF